MKHLFKPRVSGLLMTFLLFAGGTQTALALGTPSNTTISNSATVTYLVSGIGQTPVLSSPDGLTPTGITTDFLVDNKVDLLVATTDATYVPVTPGTTNQVLTFTVRNDGNTTQDFSLSTALGADPFGGLDNFNATVTAVFVESNVIPDGFQSGVDVETFIDELAPDDTATVYVLSSIPVAQSNGDIAAHALTADAHDAGGIGALGVETFAPVVADDATVVDVVLADALTPYDAQYAGDHSAESAYRIVTATLEVIKISAVNWDPFNLFVNPKAIPGARILYTITVENTSLIAVTSVVISDLMPANTTYFPGSITLNAVVQNDASPGVPADNSDFGVTAVNTVTVGVGPLAGGATATITFEVEII